MSRNRPRQSGTRHTPRVHPRGIIRITSAGYGFVQTAEGEYFIPASKTADAFDGDTVEVSRLNPREHKARNRERVLAADRMSARVVRVVTRAHETIVGHYEIAAPFGIIVPDDTRIHHDIFTIHDPESGIRTDDIVRVRIESYPNKREPAIGVVEEVLGHSGDAGMDIELIIARYKLETEFSSATLSEVASQSVQADHALLYEGYTDLRARTIFTVDPADAKDFDDALSFERVGNLRRLGVHIADVSYYVGWGSSVDLEARRRATSVYLVDRVIPMLPEKLCNDLCSLCPGKDRRTLTVDIYFTDTTEVDHIEVYPAIISSCARLTYDQAQAVIDGSRVIDGVDTDITHCIVDAIDEISILATSLTEARIKRGGIDFETQEARVLLDEQGVPYDVALRTKTPATSMVEEAMIAANEVIAQFLVNHNMPSVFRVHDMPSTDDLGKLAVVLQEFGYGKKVKLTAFAMGNPKAIQDVLAAAKGTSEEYLVTSMVLRAMKRAVYRPVCDPHFGLASLAYTHFTSPIRRYPDLIVHRMVKMALTKRSETFTQQRDNMPGLAEYSSKMERIAEKAARDSQELKLLELLETSIGKEFEGVISGVMAQGFFVRLDNTAEGFVSLRNSQEYFSFDSVRYRLTGSDTNTIYRLGQNIRIRVRSVKPYERRAEFQLVKPSIMKGSM